MTIPHGVADKTGTSSRTGASSIHRVADEEQWTMLRCGDEQPSVADEEQWTTLRDEQWTALRDEEQCWTAHQTTSQT